MKKNELVKLIKECMDEMSNLDGGMNEVDVKLDEVGVSRSLFDSIADVIKNVNGINPEIKKHFADEIGKVFASNNPRFDWNKWNAHIFSKE